MPRVVETDSSLEIQDRMTLLMRLIFGLLALFPSLAPYELLILPRWHNYLNPVFFFFALISIGALAVSGFFIWAAVAGKNKLIRFNKQLPSF
jgi:hypothetical protein